MKHGWRLLVVLTIVLTVVSMHLGVVVSKSIVLMGTMHMGRYEDVFTIATAFSVSRMRTLLSHHKCPAPSHHVDIWVTLRRFMIASRRCFDHFALIFNHFTAANHQRQRRSGPCLYDAAPDGQFAKTCRRQKSMSSHLRTVPLTITAAAGDTGALKACSRNAKYGTPRLASVFPACSRRWDVKPKRRRQDGIIMHVA